MKQIGPSKLWRLLIVLLAGAASLSMYSNPYLELLTSGDWEFEKADRDDGSALSSPIGQSPRWESFNEWQCFSTQNIHLECTELDDGSIQVPTLRVGRAGHILDFSMDPEPSFDCEQVRMDLIDLLDQEDSFCVYAAHLQEHPSENFGDPDVISWNLWIMSQVKTQKGYWTNEDLSVKENEEPELDDESGPVDSVSE